MSSNINSSGIAIDHDGEPLEVVVPFDCAPFAVAEDVFRKLFGGSGKDAAGSHLEADPVSGTKAIPGDSGGIPIEVVEVQDGYSSEDSPSPRGSGVAGNDTSATVHAILRTTKHERDALLSARKKLGDVLSFLKKRGFTEEQVLEEMAKDGFMQAPPARDNNGLPVLPRSGADASSRRVGNPFKDKMKGKDDDSHASSQHPMADQVFDDLSTKGNVDPTGNNHVHVEDATVPKEDAHNQAPENKSSANVLRSDKENMVNFAYFPLKPDEKVVEPPIDVLKKGNDQYKNCVVGTFTKGNQSYKEVSEFAHKMWGKRGVLKVF